MLWINAFLLLASLLTLFPAPARPLWYAAVLFTEWGHFFALACLVLALMCGFPKRWTWSSSLALFACFLYLSPTVRAMLIAQRLPQELDQSFGTAEQGIKARSPFDGFVLFGGLHLSPVRFSELPYGAEDGSTLLMDVYRPVFSERPAPGLLVVHGGGWQTGSRKEFQSFEHYLAARGYVVASLDYRLAPKAKYPAQIDDVVAALKTLKRHAGALNFDSHRIALLGRSAGGQIALAAAYSGRDPSIKGVVSIYGPIDLIWGYEKPTNPWLLDSRKLLRDYLGGTPSSALNTYRSASPLFAVNRQTPPTLMIHGGLDAVVSPLHNEHLIKYLDEFKRPYYYLRLPWGTHGCDLNLAGPSGQLSTYAIERFLKAVLM